MPVDDTSRVLVTTALESSWPDVDTPVLFLGEWCRLYERRSHWTRFDSEVAPYHWDDRRRLRHDFEYLQSLNESLLAQLAGRLNEVHSVQRSVDYWHLLVGYWLNTFTAALFDRWTGLHEAVGTWNISRSVELRIPAARVVGLDTSHFHRLIEDDVWNHVIYSRLLRDWTGVPIVAGERQSGPPARPRSSRGRTGRDRLLGSFAAISSHWSKPGDGLLYATGLPVADELRLQLRLGQRPRLCVSRPCPEADVDPSMRAWTLVPGDPEDIFEQIACSLVSEHLPRAFLEGYGTLVDLAGGLPWPDEPAFVWTSYAHFTDDVFKVWMAEKREAGSPLVIGQHGGAAQGLFSGGREYQHRVADHQLTWGPAGAVGRASTAVGIWKGLPKVGRRRSGAMLVTTAHPRFSHDIRSMVIAGQMVPYFEDQFRFVAALPKAIQDELVVRLSRADYDWAQQQRWKDRFPDIHLDDAQRAIFDLMRRTRLCISSYNFTSYFESISADLPTVMYWNPEHWEMDPMAEPYLEAFSRAGIFHATPESAARHVSDIWEDVEPWWAGNDVRDAIEVFREGFCRLPIDPLGELATALRARAKGV